MLARLEIMKTKFLLSVDSEIIKCVISYLTTEVQSLSKETHRFSPIFLYAFPNNEMGEGQKSTK